MTDKESITLLELRSFSSEDHDQFVLPSVYSSSVPAPVAWERRLLEPVEVYQLCSIAIIEAIEASVGAPGLIQLTPAPDMSSCLRCLIQVPLFRVLLLIASGVAV
jgi:hypothetical protein